MDSVLIVKTSAIGDVVQTFGVLEYLRRRFPHAKIDWVVEKGISSLLLAHPYLNDVIILDSKRWRKSPFAKSERFSMQAFAERLQRTTYDVVFDLQGNTKSGLIDFFCKARHKVGFGRKSVAEIPNLLFTNHKIEIDRSSSIYDQYLSLAKSYFQDTEPFLPKGVSLRITEQERERLQAVLSLKALRSPLKFMVALGSNWENKRISEETSLTLISTIAKNHNASFLVVYASESEKQKAENLVRALPDQCVAIGEMSLPFWQALMGSMKGVISMDSAALHLAATTSTPTFSVFGPSSARAYKPEGDQHHAVQGSCPYGKTFAKRCPILRSCKTGACIKSLNAKDLYESFSQWHKNLQALEGCQNQCGIQQLL